MARTTATITSNASVLIGRINRPRAADFYGATLLLRGTFGGGTVTVQVSPDNGTTLLTLETPSGVGLAATANRCITLPLIGNGSTNADQLQLYVTVAGATSPNITVDLFDNL